MAIHLHVVAPTLDIVALINYPDYSPSDFSISNTIGQGTMII